MTDRPSVTRTRERAESGGSFRAVPEVAQLCIASPPPLAIWLSAHSPTTSTAPFETAGIRNVLEDTGNVGIYIYKTRTKQLLSTFRPPCLQEYLQLLTCLHLQVLRCIYHRLRLKMLKIFQRNPVELCSVLILLAGLGQASPVELEVRSSLIMSLPDYEYMAD